MEPIATHTKDATTEDGSVITITGELFEQSVLGQNEQDLRTVLIFTQGDKPLGRILIGVSDEKSMIQCVDDSCNNIEEILMHL